MLMGGDSAERKVSLDSGRAVAKALRTAGHEAVEVDTDFQLKQPSEEITSPPVDRESHQSGASEALVVRRKLALKAFGLSSISPPDVAFLAFHGGLGENGGIQAFLEMAGIPYTGSGILASAIGMDKHISKMIFQQIGVKTPRWLFIDRTEPSGSSHLVNRVGDIIGFPCIVKPNNQGSTIGVSVVEDQGELKSAIELANKYGGGIVVEEYVPGRDLTVAILDQEALPVIEICPKHRIYDYECKYTGGMSEYVVPAKIRDSTEKEIRSQALKVYRALRCEGYGRVDFRFSPDGDLFCLEVNTLPGMTETSLLPKAAKAAGIEFPELVDRIVRLAYVKGSKRGWTLPKGC